MGTTSGRIFVHELETGVTERVSVPTGGGEGYGPEAPGCGLNGQCFFAIQSASLSISHNGRYVTFQSAATDLHPDDRDGFDESGTDVFVHDRKTATTLLADRFTNGSPATDSLGEISPDGRWITYSSTSRLVPGDDRFGEDVFLQRLPRALHRG
jgi:hypothetical protein